MLYRALFLLSLFITCSAQSVILTPKKSVVRGSLPLLVKQVFNIVGESNDEQKYLVKLGNTPLVIKSQKQWLQSSALFKDMQDSLPELAIKADGKLWFELCETYSQEVITKQVKDLLKQTYDSEKIRINIIELQSNKSAVCFPVDVKVSKIIIKKAQLLTQQLLSKVYLTDGSVVQLTWKIDFQVNGMVANTLINANEIILPKYWQRQWVAASSINVNQLMVTSDNLLSRRRIYANTLLTNENAQYLPLVKKGQNVRLIMKQPGFYIETQAKALSSGDLGQVITVLVNNAAQPIKTRVSKKGEVSAFF